MIHIPASNDVSRPPAWSAERRFGHPQRFQPTLDTFGETIADETYVAPAQTEEPPPAPVRELVPFASVLRRLA